MKNLEFFSSVNSTIFVCLFVFFWGSLIFFNFLTLDGFAHFEPSTQVFLIFIYLIFNLGSKLLSGND